MPTKVVELSLSVESGYGPLWRRLRPGISKVCEHCPRNAMVDHGFVDSFDSFETKLYDDRSAVDRVQWNSATTQSRPRVGHEQSSSNLKRAASANLKKRIRIAQ